MPVAAALNFYRQLAHHLDFDPDRQVTWLIDSQQRLMQYGELAKALGRPLRIALEIDVGLERGGFATRRRWLRRCCNFVSCRHCVCRG